ncbi:MAG: ABC transporter ATP-binding protein/permease, partial [Clostridiales bacterium]|nr:ABC transporter ATP-binding protein/permease [Clostridiales bacterium]
MKIMGKLILLVKPLSGVMCLAILLGVLGSLCAMAIPVIGAFAILSAAGGLAPAGPQPIGPGLQPIASSSQPIGAAPIGLAGLIVAAAACGLLRGAFRYGEQTCNHFIAFKLLALIRERVFEALRRLCPAKLDGKERGNLITLITGDIELLEVFYAHTVSPAAIALIASLAATAFVGAYHPVYALIAAAGYAAAGLLLPALGIRAVSGDSARLREEAGRFSSFYLDSLRGIAELARLGRGGERTARIAEKSDRMDGLRRSLNGREGAVAAIAGLMPPCFALLAVAAAFLLRQGGAIAGPAAAIIPAVAVFSSFGPALALANLSRDLPSTLAAGVRVLSLLSEQPETADIVDGAEPGFDGAASRELAFSYGGIGNSIGSGSGYSTGSASGSSTDSGSGSASGTGASIGNGGTSGIDEGGSNGSGDVLRGLTLDIPKRGITGIVGKSGSGKSTFLKLLMRFWDVPEGALLVSGVPVSKIATSRLRELMSLVSQDTDLFHDSIRANICLGRPGASDAEVEAAARKASIHDFIMSLPRGYGTEVGELGSTLSGGERQRLGLARAFLRDAPLMLLDEPTSNLDSLNEGAVLKSLREGTEGRAAVLISHRESTMSAADTVYAIEDGRARRKP